MSLATSAYWHKADNPTAPLLVRIWINADEFRPVCWLIKIQAHSKGAGLTLFRFAPFQRRPNREALTARLGLLRSMSPFGTKPTSKFFPEMDAIGQQRTNVNFGPRWLRRE